MRDCDLLTLKVSSNLTAHTTTRGDLLCDDSDVWLFLALGDGCRQLSGGILSEK